MLRVFAKRINAAQLFAAQKAQYSEVLLMTGTVPASASSLVKTTVSNLGHFLCLRITGAFSTLLDDPGAPGTPIDDGIDHLRGQLIDGAGQRKLFNDYVPLSLWLSPGRRRDGNAANAYAAGGSGPFPVANPGESLFYPTEFEYLFSANSDVLLDVKNDSDTAIRFDIAFHGIRILTGVSVAGAKGV